MAITYINRKGRLYYLHEGKTKADRPKYFFSLAKEGALAKSIPENFEIHETPKQAQVLLRKIVPKIITSKETNVIEQGMKQYSIIKQYIIDINKEVITIFLCDRERNKLDAIALSDRNMELILSNKTFEQYSNYTPMLKFILSNKEKRLFTVQGYCVLDSGDSWVDIGKPDTLQQLVKEYIKHLGQDSYYELF